jgi:nucleotide-binding universal stress UspA family protein
MKTMKTILVPTDFSKNAENALRYAINLGERMQAKIILLHCFHVELTNNYVTVDMFSTDIEKKLEEGKNKANEKLKAFYDAISHDFKYPLEYISSQNLLVDAILTITEEENVDLIIMGTQGANGILSRQIFGTNSSNVVERAKCPVITIPENATPGDIKTITYSTQYLDSDITCLQTLVDIAKLFGATIQVIHVSLYDDDDAKKHMQEFRLKVQQNVLYEDISYKLLIGSNVEQRIEGYIKEEEKVDLLVMSAHHRNLMDKLFGRSITKVLLFYLKVPLMIFHHKITKSNHVPVVEDKEWWK